MPNSHTTFMDIFSFTGNIQLNPMLLRFLPSCDSRLSDPRQSKNKHKPDSFTEASNMYSAFTTCQSLHIHYLTHSSQNPSFTGARRFRGVSLRVSLNGILFLILNALRTKDKVTSLLEENGSVDGPENLPHYCC